MTFGSYELFNRAWDRLPLDNFGKWVILILNLLVFIWIDSIKHAFNGGAAGIIAKLIVYPFDLSKKRLEVVSFEEARSKFGQVISFKILLN